MELDEGFVSNGEIKLHYVADGPADGEPVLLLHGFPQFSYEWRHQMKALAEAGYRAVAPDLRGYNLSDKPEAVEAYTLQTMAGDIAAFYKTFGWSSANLVVHDWGGGLGWYFAIAMPKMVKKLVAIDIPHPAAFRSAMHQGVQQLQRSWYMWFFQSPGVAEARFGGENIDRLIEWAFQKGGEANTISWNSGKEVFSAEDLARYKEMLSQPGQLTAALNWYRANVRPGDMFVSRPQVQLPPISLPVMLIYGTLDHAFADSVWEDTAKYCNGPFKLVPLEGVGHWSPEEAPQEVNRLILEHLKS